MHMYKRAVLYLARKKGKAALLFLIFFLVSALLLVCFSVLNGTGQAAKELRSNIGAAFYIRPYRNILDKLRMNCDLSFLGQREQCFRDFTVLWFR